MEEISTLIAHFIYTGKAQGIWSMFTYGGGMFHLDWEVHRSQLQTKALSVENVCFTEILANIWKERARYFFFLFANLFNVG